MRTKQGARTISALFAFYTATGQLSVLFPPRLYRGLAPFPARMLHHIQAHILRHRAVAVPVICSQGLFTPPSSPRCILRLETTDLPDPRLSPSLQQDSAATFGGPIASTGHQHSCRQSSIMSMCNNVDSESCGGASQHFPKMLSRALDGRTSESNERPGVR